MKVDHYVSCFVVRAAASGHEFLQLKRAKGRYMGETWQLVTGGIEPGETAWQAALRELREETSLVPVEFYQLDVVNTFYLARSDAILLSPMFCAIVSPEARVVLNEEHTEFRWLSRDKMADAILWPGEKQAFTECCREILDDGPCKLHLRIEL